MLSTTSTAHFKKIVLIPWIILQITSVTTYPSPDNPVLRRGGIVEFGIHYLSLQWCVLLLKYDDRRVRITPI